MTRNKRLIEINELFTFIGSNVRVINYIDKYSKQTIASFTSKLNSSVNN